MTTSETYKQDQRVYFKLGAGKPEGWATVCGVQGFVVIIEPEKAITDFYKKNEPYPYTHLYVIESQISETEPEDDVELKVIEVPAEEIEPESDDETNDESVEE